MRADGARRRAARAALAAGVLALATRASIAADAAPPGAGEAFRHVTTVGPYGAAIGAGRYAAADSAATAALARVLAAPRVDSLVLAAALDDALECATIARPRDPSLPALAERALALHVKWPGRDSLLFARSLLAQGDLLRRRGEYLAALPRMFGALGTRERALPHDDPEVAGACQAIAVCFQSLGNLNGLPYADRAARIRERAFGPDDIRTAIARYTRGALRRLSSEAMLAADDFEAVQRVYRRVYPPRHPELVKVAVALAVSAADAGDFARARRVEEEILAEFEAAVPLDTAQVTSLTLRLIELRQRSGESTTLLPLADRALALARRSQPPGSLAYAQAQYRWASVMRDAHRAAEAAAAFDSAITVNAALAPSDSAAMSVVVLDKATTLHAARDPRAEAWARRALRLCETTMDASMPFLAEPRELLGHVLVDAGRPGEAVEYFERARAAVEPAYGAWHPNTLEALEGLARAQTAAGDTGAFATALRVAAGRAEHQRANVRGFSEREALLFTARDGNGLDAVLELAAAGRLDEAERSETFTALAGSRALVLDELAARERLRRTATAPGTRAIADSLAEARASLARWLVRAPGREAGERFAAGRDRALADVERWEHRLADAGIADRLPERASAAQLAAALRPGEALVSYAAFRSAGSGVPREWRLVAFVQRAGSAPAAVALGRTGVIDSLVARWRADVALGLGDPALERAAERRCRTSGTALRARMWDPLAAPLAGANRVFVVPEGALHLVDFAALPAPGGRWLADDGPTFAVLGAERDLLATPPAAGPERLLAIGGPDFDARTAARAGEPIAAALRGAPPGCDDFAAVRFAALPGAAAEAADVERDWRRAGRGESVRLVGADAGEAAIKRDAPSATVLHVATHGFFLSAGCVAADGAKFAASRGAGRIVAARNTPPRAAEPPAPAAAFSPLRLSGLALAGANLRREAGPGQEDGVLTSEEIAALDLSRVRDVVLSACDTGTGDVAVGEGVLGLQRAFRLAGAGSLVMSLWSVDDRATRAWMTGWDEARYARRLDAAAAVRAADQARLAALRREGRPTPPARWAGFVASSAAR